MQRTIRSLVPRAVTRAALASAAVVVACGLAIPATAARLRPQAATLPQPAAAKRAASWLSHQVTAKGDLVSDGKADDSDTALAVLALAAAGDHAVAKRALTYLEAHVDAYVTEDGSDGPGELATLILGAKALGMKPTSFGGTNLVSRLLATLQTTGANAGLFGAQDPTYDGAYRQGLALSALAAAGVRDTTQLQPAIRWLQHQQCANGAWEADRTSTTSPCPPSDPTTYSGPDTNSTALAVEGLVAQHATIPVSPVSFLASLEQPSGGFGYYGGAADPDSTALVIQALVALGKRVNAAPFLKGAKDPASALLSFQLHGGAFFYPGSKAANDLSTEQALPALEKDAFPF